MTRFNILVVASTVLSLCLGVDASSYAVAKRNQEPSKPSCSSFTPFKYAGCYSDSGSTQTLLFTGPRSTTNMTVETCVAFCKGNLYEYAGLEYYGECFCGASVNGPQVNESSCSFPCTGDKTETCGGNKLINIYQDTSFPVVDNTSIADYNAMGCYSEGYNGRALAWRQSQLSTSNLTVESCLHACKDGGFSFAGVEFGQECYCGVVLGNGTAPISSTKCNKPCTGNSTELCGGSSTLNLYVAVDLESTQPCLGGNGTNSTTSSSSSSVIYVTTVSSSSTSTSSLPASTSSVDSSTVVTSSSSYSSSYPSSTSSVVSSSTSDVSSTVSSTSDSSSSAPSSSSSISSSSPSSSTSSSYSSSQPSSTSAPSSSDSTTSVSSSTSQTTSSDSSSSAAPSTSPTSVTDQSVSSSSSSSSQSSSSSYVSSDSITSSSSTSSSAPSSSSSSSSSQSSSSSYASSDSITSSSSTSSSAPSSSSSVLSSTSSTSSSSSSVYSAPSSSSSSTIPSTSSTSTVTSSSSSLPLSSSSSASVVGSSTSSSQGPATSPSSTTTSCKTATTTPQPPPTSTPCTTSTSVSKSSSSSTLTKTTVSLCSKVVTISPTPTCEYKCGNWCSSPLPEFNDNNSCSSAFSTCELQLMSCYLNAGYPNSLSCGEFSKWCSSVSSYCNYSCPGGNCNKKGCLSQNPPPAPPAPSAVISTSVYPCQTTSTKPSSTSSTPSSTSCVPVPTNSNICIQPHNPARGYSSNSPVGGIGLPCLTCNNLQNDYNSGNPFKLYLSSDSSKCPSYQRTGTSGPSQGCKDACDNQYQGCMNTYAQGCQNSNSGGLLGSLLSSLVGGGQDTYSSATTKCSNQRNDCYSANSGVSGSSRCGSWNTGWSR